MLRRISSPPDSSCGYRLSQDAFASNLSRSRSRDCLGPAPASKSDRETLTLGSKASSGCCHKSCTGMGRPAKLAMPAPSISTVPRKGLRYPAKIRQSVVLPVPEGAEMATRSPGDTVRSRSENSMPPQGCRYAIPDATSAIRHHPLYF